jgi:hypothetical protein
MGKEAVVPRALTAIGLVLSFIWFYWFQKASVGYSSVTIDGITHVVAGTTPATVLLSTIGIFLFTFLMVRRVRVETFRPSSITRRFVAFLFDCWFLMLTVVGASSMLHLLLEAQRSGSFRWQYERESGAAPNGADVVIVLINLPVMFMYFVAPLARRRQTVGHWVFRLATVSAGGSLLYLPFSTAVWRTFMAFRGLISPWRFLKETDAEGRTWYDRETGFTVVRY